MGRLSLAQLKRVHVQFNALDAANSSVREFLSRCTAPKTIESNPKCEITHRLRIDDQPPVVAVEFANGAKEVINCRDISCQDIIKRVQQKTEEMDTLAILKAAGLDNLQLSAKPGASRRA
jgi:large subunit ribosomal protein L53